jgi:hypothetical protein
MLVKTETLARMFEANTDKTQMCYTDRCRSCGRSITIEIHHLSSGYGLLGGALFEEGSNHLSLTCESCLKGQTKPLQ